MSESKLVESISIDEETGFITIKKQGLKEAKIMTCPLTSDNDFCNIDCIACYYKETTSQISIYCKQFFKFHCYKEKSPAQMPIEDPYNMEDYKAI